MFPLQICTLHEILAYILNSVKRKRKRNVLAHGYNFLSLAQEERDADHFKLQGDVTQSAAYIHGSDLWKKVSMRLGTDITRYLLESCSVFVAIPPSCFFQVCGVPVYDRVSMTTASLGRYRQSRPRTHKGARFRCRQGAATWRQTHVGVISTLDKKRMTTDVRVKLGKRKREAGEEDEFMTSSGKRRRAGQQELRQSHYETTHEAQIARPPQSVKHLENGTSVSKKPVEMQTNAVPLEGGPSWRSGIFPPLPPSQSFIRTLGFLYGGRGMRGFLLNRKKKSADGFRRLQGRDLLRLVFFEGLPYLNGLERKPRKLPQRFFNMVPLFNQLLRQHRRYPYSRTLRRLCPLMGNKDAGGELSTLLPQHCGPHRVYLFIKECLSAVIPQELWGSEQNRLLFFFRVRAFLRSGKFERLSLAELMWKIKVNDCDWLKISKTGTVL